MDKPVTPERLDQLIAFAEQCNKPWLCVDVPNALRELRELRSRTEAMRPYLRHTSLGNVQCSKGWAHRSIENDPCICGLDALLGKP